MLTARGPAPGNAGVSVRTSHSGRQPYQALTAAAGIVTAAAVLDVLADGPLRHLDQWVFSGDLPS
ncbi:hypothetical protein GCM10009527_044750 [Actinomadura nitritigenes]